MPQIDIDGANSKLSADKIQGQSGTTVTVPTGHTLAVTDAGGLTVNGSAVPTSGGLTSKVMSGSYDMSTTGSIAITGVGFQPTACIFFLHKDGNAAASWGLVSTTITDDGNIHDFHNSTADRMNSAGDLWTLYTSGSDVAKGVLASYDSGGATFTKSKTGSPTGTAYYKILFMK